MKIVLHCAREVLSGNALAYAHWRNRMKDREAWRLHIQAALPTSVLRPATGKRTVHVLAYRKRTLDDDNLCSGFKHGRDCLVRLGLLKDDSPAWASFTYEQQPARQSPTGYPHTTITIEDSHA